MRLITRVVQRGLLAAGLAGALVLAGCGWTPRDEFLRSRSVSLRSQSGDGSEITWNPRTQPGYRTAGAEVASRFDEGR